MSWRASALALAAAVLLTACGSTGDPETETALEVTSATAQQALLATDGEPLIDPAEIVDAASYDGIPAIDDPVPLDRAFADQLLEDTEQVMLVEHGGAARAYPVRALIRHEIVNDEVAGRPVAVTWCPLCNTGIVFDRRVNGTAEVFGVSGSLYRSALIMFDRRTRSLWPQPLGTAVLGPLLGTELTVLASSLLPWSQVRDAHPSVQVVMGSGLEFNETGNPYEGYDVSGDPFLFRGEVDDRLPAFDRVVGVTVAEQSQAWTYDSLRARRTAQATVSDQPVVVLWAPGSASPLETTDVRTGRDVGSAAVYDPRLDGRMLTFSPAGRTEFTDRETGSRWTLAGLAVDGPLEGSRLTALPHQDAFWFAWAAFQPDTGLVT